MSAAAIQIVTQFRMDVRDRGTLLVFYAVPLAFYLVVGAVFSAANPEIIPILSATMVVFSVSMGAFIGIPPTLVKLRESGTLRAYQVSGIPIRAVILSIGVSALAHLSIVSAVIAVTAPLLFGAELPGSAIGFVAVLTALLVCSVAVGLLIGAVCTTQSMAMMVSQAVFMPTLLLSGIMFPAHLLPTALAPLGEILPATHAMHAFNALAYELPVDRSPGISLAAIGAITVAVLAAAIWRYGKITRVS